MQYDRLALMYLGDNEVWRTSTAEPTAAPGVRWTYWTDLTSYLALWRQPQTVIFDLGNIVDAMYTGILNCTLTATFFEDDLPGLPSAPPADVVLPVSLLLGAQGAASAFTYPPDNASTALTLPRNANRAVFAISANGQSDEEFWWTNVPQSGADVFGSADALPGLSAFREVQVSIDGRVAGLAWPFPVIFTGGISPPLHRPIVGLEAFDLREYEVDITPWLGYLSDGRPHTFSMDVYGVNDTGTTEFAQVASYWVLTGKVLLWLDEDQHHVTRGSAPEVSISRLDFEPNEVIKPNVSLAYRQTVHRSIEVRGSISTQYGHSEKTWTQQFYMSNDGFTNNDGNYQTVAAQYVGSDKAISDGSTYFYTGYSYPINLDYSYEQPDGAYDYSLTATLYQGLDRTVTGLTALSDSLEPFIKELPRSVSGSSLNTFRNGTAFFYAYDDQTKSSGYGSMHQYYTLGAREFADAEGVGYSGSPLLYLRDVDAVNNTVVSDKEYAYNWPTHQRGPSPWHSQHGGFAPLPHGHRGRGVSITSSEDGSSQGSLDVSARDDSGATLRRNMLRRDW